MSEKRIQKLLSVCAVITLIAVPGVELYLELDLLAALLIFLVVFAAMGIAILMLFLLGEAMVRCFGLLATCAASFRLREPAPSVVATLTRGIGKS